MIMHRAAMVESRAGRGIRPPLGSIDLDSARAAA
jgi:hypothetical protein